MKHLISRITLVTTLFIATSCSSGVKSRDALPKEAIHQGENSTSQHEGDSIKENSATTQAKLTVPKNVVANQPIPLAIDIQNSTGKVVTNFDIQQKQMDLIVVSDDLKFFDRIHPIYKGNGRFEINPSLPNPGGYTLFSDYKPSKEKKQVTIQKVSIPGKVPLPTELEKFSNTKILANTKVNLNFSEAKPQAGKEVTLTFDLKEVSTKQAIKDLQPYLGEKGHLVIIKSSSPLTKSDYIHAQARKDSPDGKVQFITSFPQSGTYKIWGQFNRNGKIITADFWVNVF
jgi:hypothetical protein